MNTWDISQTALRLNKRCVSIGSLGNRAVRISTVSILHSSHWLDDFQLSEFRAIEKGTTNSVIIYWLIL